MPKKQKVHFIAPYFLNPVHRIRVDLIGAGGSGSQMFSALSRINAALEGLGHPGLYVRVYDPDIVEAPNIGRQLFSPSEIGRNKAVALVSRFNRAFGTDWDAVPAKWSLPDEDRERANIIISCVDNLATRKKIAEVFEGSGDIADEYRTWYWLDLGNARRTGQAVLGSADIAQPKVRGVEAVRHLPLFTQCFDVDSIDEKESGPSCSMAEALRKQDLFVNSVLVQLSGSLLWSLLRESRISVRGFYMNLETLTCLPMEL